MPPTRRGHVAVGGEVIRTPAFAALLRRYPGLARHSSIAAIVGGVGLFAAAAVAMPLAGADVAQPPPPPPARPSTSVPAVPAFSIDPLAPAVTKVLKGDPTHVKKPAPVTHGVISGLAANGIPKVALNAYRVAAARMANVEPSCGIDWSLLAGIGREESDHGRFAGAVLHADGVSTPRIVGPALDGVHWDYIPAPGNGQALDGDAKYAHALGPMQFIPSTWAIYGTDADGDRKADIFDINDAALGAARYLCAAGGNLRGHDGQVRGVLAYNHSDQYLAQVLALADAYRRGIPVTGIPVGITTGALPRVTDTGYIPPANPAAPTAAHKAAATSAKPRPRTSSSSAPRTSSAPTTKRPRSSPGASGSTAPSPSKSSSTPRPTGSTSSPSTTPTPTATPTHTCNVLQLLCKP
jgi:Transglycosylase SLT domain